MDSVTVQRIALLHPKLRDEVSSIYQEICNALTGRSICRFAYTIRTFDEQNALYAKGRTTGGSKVTNAKGGMSFHQYGLACDIVLLKDKDGNGTFESASWETNVDFDGDGKADWQEIVQIFKEHGFEWGGDWKFTDKPHFQKTFGLSVRDCLKLHNENKFIPNTNYIQI
jgi:peptidoglycan L-alanyl-D-glutamate endopeptidase CwlK